MQRRRLVFILFTFREHQRSALESILLPPHCIRVGGASSIDIGRFLLGVSNLKATKPAGTGSVFKRGEKVGRFREMPPVGEHHVKKSFKLVWPQGSPLAID